VERYIGHFKRDCPQPLYNRLSKCTRKEAFYVDALMSGKQQKSLIDTEQYITLVPESLVKGVSLGEEVDLRGVYSTELHWKAS